MADFESVSSVASVSGSGQTLAVTKPSGLAVGDLMVAHLAHLNNPAQEWNELSGWSRVVNLGTGGAHSMSVQLKIADANDVAASDFTFSLANSSLGTRKGAIFRISNTVSLANIITRSNRESGSTYSSGSTSGGTPHGANSLLMAFVGNITSGSDRVSSYAVATSNPSWTEAYDADSFAAAYATRSQITATGSASVSLTGNPGAYNMAFLIISPPVPASGTADLHTASPTFFSTTGAAGTNGTAALHTVSPAFFDANGRAEQKTVWSNEAKGSTSWNNEPK